MGEADLRLAGRVSQLEEMLRFVAREAAKETLSGIGIIKALRMVDGIGLKEAKDEYDRLRSMKIATLEAEKSRSFDELEARVRVLERLANQP